MYAIDEDLPFPVGTIDANVLRGDSDSGEESSVELETRTGTDPAHDYALVANKPSPTLSGCVPHYL